MLQNNAMISLRRHKYHSVLEWNPCLVEKELLILPKQMSSSQSTDQVYQVDLEYVNKMLFKIECVVSLSGD
jgi:hypothetical protein